VYVGDPTLGIRRSLDDLDEQLDEIPHAVGAKLRGEGDSS
jgi:hypothetical protein